MKKELNAILTTVIVATLLAFSGGQALAAKKQPLTPEAAAKRERVLKQKKQQHISQNQRDTAAQELKAQRMKILRAKRAAKSPITPQPN